jgi:hypothetical protein
MLLLHGQQEQHCSKPSVLAACLCMVVVVHAIDGSTELSYPTNID